LVGTRLLGKISLLAKVLVITMVISSIWILRLLRCHRLTPIIGRKGLGLRRIPIILGRVTPVDLTCIGHEPCPGFHWLWKGFPLVGIPNKGTDPCHIFQSPCEEGIPKFFPCVVIVPCIGFGCP
jgi:hypothetical protein